MIYLFWGTPGAGKTYSVVAEAVSRLKAGKTVYSNFPIIHEKYGSSYKWEQDYIYQSVYDATIILDEAYRDFNSRKFKNFTDDMHQFFATNRHNKLDIFLLSQNPARIDKIIRESANIFYYITKFHLPLMKAPLWFKCEGYLQEADLNTKAESKVFSRKRYLFCRSVAKSYDTHYFRKDDVNQFQPVLWSDSK